MSNWPASVSTMPRAWRSNSWAWCSPSSLRTMRLTADGATCSFCAARVSEPASTTSRK
ncbi:Uncharacterised protein [Bordetella pertussis]|nr:Uncharacterised protein [Bordetella pertussis]CFW39106.1 Uncharacterised protein [Bordetella pertussis]